MKKLISLALACSFMMAAAVMPMTGAAAEMQVIDFSAAEGASYGGTIAADAATQNPCLAVAEDETASITFDETAATVDFKLKAADSAKPVTVTLGSDVLTFTGDAVTLGETPISFVAGLWYNLRVTAAGSGAVLYIDGVQMGTLAGTDAGFAALGISGAAYVDDVIAYTAAQETNRGMTATVLDFGGFENLTLATGSTATQRTGTAPSSFKKSFAADGAAG